MKLLTLTSVLLMGLVINNAIRRNNAKTKKIHDEFWEKERSSHNAPERPTDDLNFIRFPSDLPLHLSIDDPRIREYQETLENLTKKRVINLSGISNTDIRLAYGSKNMEELSRADELFIILCRNLNALSSAYLRAGYREEACRLLQFAVSSGSDIRETWSMLGQYYLDNGNATALKLLIDRAGKLDDSLNVKKDILKSLNDQAALLDIVS